MWLLAETVEPISLSGGAGWAGAGLLGGVLAWLLFIHLPNKDKQLQKMIEDKDAIIRDLAKTYSESLTDARREFREWLQVIATNDEVRTKALTDAISRELVVLQQAVKDRTQ